MSADDDDSGVLGPTVSTTPRVNAVTTQGILGGSPARHDLDLDNFREEYWMQQYGGKRNLFDALGYVQDPDYEHYRARYERTDTASALVDKLPKKAWSLPNIIDVEADEGESEFEDHINRLLAGEYTEDNPINVMERASRMERLGQFALIFVGFNDDNAKPDENDREGVALLEKEVDTESLAGKDPEDAIQFLTPYDEGRVDTDLIDWHTEDPTHPRYGKPKTYNVELGEIQSHADIHWTRSIHIAGNLFDNELRSPSVLKQSLNRIDDIEKILGGSAEGFWRAAYTGLVVSPPQVNGTQTEFADDGEQLSQQINRYINNLSREIFTQADIETIDVTVEDPSGHLESEYKALSTGHDLPQSILMGNETGERATEEDRQMWHERVKEFREEYCLPRLLEPFIDRLIDFNVIPEPQGGRYAYNVEWPPLDAPTEQERWNIAQTKSNALSTGTAGDPLAVVSPEEYREKVLGWKPERGAESEAEPSEIDRMNATVTMDADIADAYIDEFGKDAFIPPEGAQEKAQRILDLREEHDVNGGTETGWSRAEQLAEGVPVPPDEVIQIAAWFARHPKSEADYDTEHAWQDNGWTARMLWGWDQAERWASDLAEQIKDFREESDRVNAIDILLEYWDAVRVHEEFKEKDKVNTPDGRGVVIEKLTQGFEVEEDSVEASEEEPKWVVVTENADKPFGYYTEDELEHDDWDAGVESPTEDLRNSGDDRENLNVRLKKALAALTGRSNVAGDGIFTWPESWRESEKPARLIALDAWTSMGGDVSACIREMRGNVVDPGRFCADFADRLYQWDYWRGDSWLPGE